MPRVLLALPLLVCIVVLHACGHSPMAPTQPAAFAAEPAGSWRGTTSISSCASVGGPLPGTTLDVCLNAGSLPITLQLQQSGETVSGEVAYQGSRVSVSGRLSGFVVRLDGGVGPPLADPGAPLLEIRGWETRFLDANQMAGAFKLVIVQTRDGVPSTVTIDIQVNTLVRSGPA